MSCPKFSFISDSVEPKVKSGTASWVDPSGTTTTQKFDTFADAARISNLVEAAYKAGFQEGQRALRNTIYTALKGV